jgi:hypothetical protein
MPRNKRKPEFYPEHVRDISEAVYRARLEDNKAGAVERMLEKDGDGGTLLRSRAGSYDVLTRAYLRVLK